MKSNGATRRREAAQLSRCSVVAIRWRRAAAFEIACAAALALMLAVATAGPSQAQDAAKEGSSWERVDSVLVLPPVFQPDAEPAPADTCAQDCPDPGVQDGDESPSAVAGTADNAADPQAGTADNPTDESVAVGGIAPDGSDPQEEQQASVTSGNPRGSGELEDSPEADQNSRGQRAAAERGGYAVAQAPPLIVAVPIRPYRAPRTFAPAPPVFAPAWSPPASPAWMPPPMVRMAPLPSIVSRGFSPTSGGFPGAFYGRSGGIAQPNMPGLQAGFGSR